MDNNKEGLSFVQDDLCVESDTSSLNDFAGEGVTTSSRGPPEQKDQASGELRVFSSSIRIRAPHTTIFYSNDGVFVKYCLVVEEGEKKWISEKRFSDLVKIHKFCKDTYNAGHSFASLLFGAAKTFPSFPRRTLVGKATNQSIKAVIMRRVAVDTYFHQLTDPNSHFLSKLSYQRLKEFCTPDPSAPPVPRCALTTRDSEDNFVDVVEKSFVLAYFKAPDHVTTCYNKDWQSYCKPRKETVRSECPIRESDVLPAVGKIPSLVFGLPYAKMCFDPRDLSKMQVVLRCEKTEPKAAVVYRFKQLLAFYLFAATQTDSLPTTAEARRFFHEYAFKNPPPDPQAFIRTGASLQRENLPPANSHQLPSLQSLLYNACAAEHDRERSASIAQTNVASRKPMPSSTNSKHLSDNGEAAKRCACTNQTFCYNGGGEDIHRFICACGKQITIVPPLPRV